MTTSLRAFLVGGRWTEEGGEGEGKVKVREPIGLWPSERGRAKKKEYPQLCLTENI